MLALRWQRTVSNYAQSVKIPSPSSPHSQYGRLSWGIGFVFGHNVASTSKDTVFIPVVREIVPITASSGESPPPITKL
jgi:hypothetical protein